LGGGYSAGYYAYTWSKTLDYNVYDWMKANGGLTRKNSERFRKYILSVGNSVDLNEAFKIYRTRYGNRALFKKCRTF
jgi:peptidyl-dipeptidase Dcp